MIKKNARAYTMDPSIVLAKGRLIISTKLRKSMELKLGPKYILKKQIMLSNYSL